MYAPHSVTVYSVRRETENTRIVFLEGVLLDTAHGVLLSRTGAAGSRGAVLYIPAECRAADAVTGELLQYCPFKTFQRMDRPDGFWSIGPGGQLSGADCFFVKGLCTETELDYAGMRERFDHVYRVSAVDVRDFGSPELRHLQVEGV